MKPSRRSTIALVIGGVLLVTLGFMVATKPVPTPVPSLGTVLLAQAQTQQPILATNLASQNRPHSSSPDWAKDVCGGHTFLDLGGSSYEWTQVINPDSEFDDYVAAVSGVAIWPHISGEDMPFTHPFGNDWEFFIAPDPDPQYTLLLAPHNLGNAKGGEDHLTAINRATALDLKVPQGVLEVETDQDLVPPSYRLREGDRVALFGRWIVDCGHDDFVTEIHPPLVLVGARSSSPTGVDLKASLPPETTTSWVISRPFLVGQRFQVDNEPLRQHLLNEIAKVESLIPQSWRVEAHPKIYKPFRSDRLFVYTVRPPSPRRSPNDKLLVNFHFTVRQGVTVQVTRSGADSVNVTIRMSAATYQMAGLPRKHDWDIPFAYLCQKAGVKCGAVLTGNIFLGHVLGGALLTRDWLTDRYDAPQATRAHDSERTISTLDELRPNTGITVDDGQPFPIYGDLALGWDHQVQGLTQRPIAIQAKAHVQDIGWMAWVTNPADTNIAGTVGQRRRMEAVQIRLNNAPAGIRVCYAAHVQDIGWMGEVCDGDTAGTTGRSKRMEAVQIRLINAPAGTHVCYAAHVQNFGWMEEVCDGATAGTTGKSLRLEALRMRITIQ